MTGSPGGGSIFCAGADVTALEREAEAGHYDDGLREEPARPGWGVRPDFDHPFAFALIRPDGADTAMVHAVDAGSIEHMSTGMRVEIQFRPERQGAITDAYFVPEADAEASVVEPGDEPVTITEHFIGVRMHEQIHPFRARYYEALLDGRFLGQRSPADGKVYVPSRGYDPLNRVMMTEQDDVDVADIIAATIPGGSVTGAPKIRAMEILDRLEPVRRGPYTGAAGFVGDDGDVCLNILIRTYQLLGEKLTWQVGAGIVADSIPAEEWQECLDKGAAMQKALRNNKD